MWMQDGCKVYVDSYMVSNGPCFMFTWTIFKSHLLEVGLDHGTPNAHNCWFILDYHVWGPAWIDIHWITFGWGPGHIRLHITPEGLWPHYMILKVCWNQYSRSKSSMPFNRDLALQNIPLSKQPFETQPQIGNEDDASWSPQYDMPATRTNKRRASSLQEVKLDGWFLILHIVLENMYYIIHAQV